MSLCIHVTFMKDLTSIHDLICWLDKIYYETNIIRKIIGIED